MAKVAEFKHLFTETLTPTAAVTRCRFVDAAGNQLTVAGARSLGVSIDALTADDLAAARNIGVVIIGVAELEVGAAVAKNAKLTSDNQGRGITAGAGQSVNAIARTAGAAAGDRISALLVLASETPA
jgi:hypothetical protein